MWQSLTLVKPCVYRKKWEHHLHWLVPHRKWINPCMLRVQTDLEILLDTLWIEAFGDDDHPSLDAET